jgi:hypothetical protein
MQKYLLIGSKITIEFGFRESDGLLCFMHLPENISDQQTLFVCFNCPADLQALEVLGEKTSSKIQAVPKDLSFETFWKEYNYKVGNKARSIKLWNQLSENDRAKCLLSIPRYDQFLAMRLRQEKAYPETYLNQRRFENQF